MTKIKTAYFCKNCGAQSPKWIGKCSSCDSWNTYEEEIIYKEKGSSSFEKTIQNKSSKPVLIDEISVASEVRIDSMNNEINRVLGGGIVPGSLVLIGGEPGIGKSTLMLQMALGLKNLKVMYISGEESDQQIKMRAERLGSNSSQCYVLTETNTQYIFKHIEAIEPDIIIIDSIQTLTTELLDSSAGSISQIRECAAELNRFAKNTHKSVFIIGHITKDGTLAGPKILEHMVDTVLQFEGDRNYIYRILRATKNRFGSTSELGIFEMLNDGLREVANPSEILISQFDEPLSGVTISATIEGLRPMLIETQALVSSAAYGTPQRSSTGFDLRRLNMLLAVLEKRCGFRLGIKDVFLNITGGIKVDDPAIDLGVVTAILSSSEDIPIPDKTCFAAEVGLSGEIRPINRIEQRISEAEKLGFQKIFISKYNLKAISDNNFNIKIVPVSKIEELFNNLFGRGSA